MTQHTRFDRRRFLTGLCGAFAAGTVGSLLPQLSLARGLAAKGAGSYRALVCVYLAGANDSYNWLVPRDADTVGSRYDAYRTARGGVYSGANTAGLAHAFTDLLPIAPSNQPIAYGLHPACTDFTANNGGTQAHKGLQTLFGEGRAAFVANVGPLVQPINKSQYNAGAPRPAQLFSHNDQDLLWQLGLTDVASPLAKYGWGGRMAVAAGITALPNGLSPCISVAGASRLLVGQQITPYQMSTSGVDLLNQYIPGSNQNNFPADRRALLNDLLDDTQSNPIATEYAAIMRRALGVGEAIYTQLESSGGQVATVFPSTNLSDQLKMVARMIKLSRGALGAQRQIYYVRIGGYDLHDGMFVNGQPVATSGHGALLTDLNQALGAFWSALNEIGAQNEVTTFTMSDFGRTLSGNGNGSDHAWGGNHLVLGGAVDGGKIYGRYPQLVLDADDNTNQDWSFSRGQYIPTTAVDQLAATLSKWMGVTDNAALDAIFPNLANFGARDLGFMLP